MKVLLRSKGTQFYYTGPGRWEPQAEHALDFGSIEQATRVFWQEPFADAEIVLRSEAVSAEAPVPILSRGPVFGRGSEVDPQPWPARSATARPGAARRAGLPSAAAHRWQCQGSGLAVMAALARRDQTKR